MTQDRQVLNVTLIFDVTEYSLAYRMTNLAKTIVFGAYIAIKSDFGLVRSDCILSVCLSHFEELTAQEVACISRRSRYIISHAVHRMLSESYIDRAPQKAALHTAALEE